MPFPFILTNLASASCVSTPEFYGTLCPLATWLALAARLRRPVLAPTPTGTGGPRTKPLQDGEEGKTPRLIIITVIIQR